MRFLYVLLLGAYVLPAFSQSGFNKTPEFSYYLDHFRNLIVHNDTIVCYGMARQNNTSKQCLFLARFDTTGLLLDERLICDSLGGDLSMDFGWAEIVTTSDGGYALTGISIDRYDGMFIKLRRDLSAEFIQEYVDSINLVEFYNSIVELPDGYLLGGHIQRPNFLQDAFLRKVDKQGNSVWFSYYGEYEVYDLFSNYNRLNDTLIVYSGAYEENPNTISGRGPWICLINIDGEVLKEWHPDDDVPIDIIHYLHPVSDDTWILYGINVVQGPYPDNYETFIALIDTNFQILAVRPYDGVHYYLNFLWDVTPTLDGNFVGAGRIIADNGNIEPDVYGRLFKFSPDLDSLWSLKLTAPIPNVQESGNYFGGVGLLSSGNMVAGGYSHAGSDIYCWLVKFTPDGCVDTLWCATSPAWEPLDLLEAKISVYPNPSNGKIFVDLPPGIKKLNVVITSFDGRIVIRKVLDAGTELDLSSMPAGLYLVSGNTDSGIYFSQKLVLSQ